MKLDELKTLLRNSGVVGAGGAGFPTYAKLSDKVDTIILNCAECEPLLKLHRQALEIHVSEILTAFNEIVKATGAKRGIVAVKKHYKAAVSALESEIGDYPSISVFKLESVYPAGDEVILVKRVTGRSINPGELPGSVGVTVCNVETVYNVYRALNGAPVTHKYVTVAGEVKNPITVYAPIGTKIADLVKLAGGETVEDAEYLSGGPMMGKLVSPNDSVTKTTNAIIVLPETHNVIMGKKLNGKINLRRTMSVCCQCHTCTDLCSRHVAGYPVEPHLVMRVLSNGGRGDSNSILGSMFCSGCGLCESYSCPQGLSPKALIDEIKAQARMNGVMPPRGIKALEHTEHEEYRTVSVERLTSRLGLKKYDVAAPITDIPEINSVRIKLSQHIGVSSTPCVQVGDEVKKGDVIASAAEKGLGVNIHASINGRVTDITQKYVKIEKI